MPILLPDPTLGQLWYNMAPANGSEVMFCGWEGNCSFAVELVIRHRLSDHQRVHSSSTEMLLLPSGATARGRWGGHWKQIQLRLWCAHWLLVDCCFVSVPYNDTKFLQSPLHSAAGLVTRKRKFDDIMSTLRDEKAHKMCFFRCHFAPVFCGGCQKFADT